MCSGRICDSRELRIPDRYAVLKRISRPACLESAYSQWQIVAKGVYFCEVQVQDSSWEAD